MTTIVALTGLAGYLALVGGGLLWIRFHHAGLPVIQALNLVPPQALITTALVEISRIAFLPVLVALGVGGLVLLSARGSSEPPQTTAVDDWVERLRKPVYGVVLLAIILTIPLTVYGFAFLVSIAAPIALVTIGTPLLRRISRMHYRIVFYAAFLGLFACVPVFAREASDPPNLEGVRVVRAGHPDLFAGLVSVRDGSVALAHCGRLIVVPTPAQVEISDQPSGSTTGRSLLDRLGVRSDRAPGKARRMC